MTQSVADVRAHMQSAESPAEAGNQADLAANSARSPARARVIPLRPQRRQDDTPDEASGSSTAGSGGLLVELRLGATAAAEAAEASDLAREPMSPVDAAKQIAPAAGEAANRIAWVAMTLAGVLRLLGVSVGWLFSLGFETRIRAAVTTGVLLVALALSAVADTTG